jgi:hypothetical protein
MLEGDSFDLENHVSLSVFKYPFGSLVQNVSLFRSRRALRIDKYLYNEARELLCPAKCYTEPKRVSTISLNNLVRVTMLILCQS